MEAIIALVVFTFLFYFSFVKTSFAADLVINEFSSASNPEWVELYNSGEQSYSLQGVVLFFNSNVDTTTQKVSFCASDEIPPKSYKLINRSINSFWLADVGDTLTLKKEDDIIDLIAYGSGQSLKAPTATQSATRQPDGGGWSISNTPTSQGSEASFTCSTPTPTPTSTPTPTPIPTSTSIPTPTQSPMNSSIPSKTPSVSLSPTPEMVLNDLTFSDVSDSAVLSTSDAKIEPSFIPEKNLAESGNKTPNIFMALGIIVLIVSGILGFLTIRKNGQ